MKPEPLKDKKQSMEFKKFPTNDLIVCGGFTFKDIKSAVEWLKYKCRTRKIFLIHKDRLNKLNSLIDEAFEDVIKK